MEYLNILEPFLKIFEVLSVLSRLEIYSPAVNEAMNMSGYDWSSYNSWR